MNKIILLFLFAGIVYAQSNANFSPNPDISYLVSLKVQHQDAKKYLNVTNEFEIEMGERPCLWQMVVISQDQLTLQYYSEYMLDDEKSLWLGIDARGNTALCENMSKWKFRRENHKNRYFSLEKPIMGETTWEIKVRRVSRSSVLSTEDGNSLANFSSYTTANMPQETAIINPERLKKKCEATFNAQDDDAGRVVSGIKWYESDIDSGDGYTYAFVLIWCNGWAEDYNDDVQQFGVRLDFCEPLELLEWNPATTKTGKKGGIPIAVKLEYSGIGISTQFELFSTYEYVAPNSKRRLGINGIYGICWYNNEGFGGMQNINREVRAVCRFRYPKGKAGAIKCYSYIEADEDW